MHWKNVTYVVNWYADGRHVYTEPEFCKPTNEGAGANDQPCPGKNEIRSYLRGVGNNYYPGQWVSNFVGVIFVSVKLYFCNVLFIVTFKNKMICGGLWRRQSARSTTVVGEIEDWGTPFQSQFQHWKWKK